MLSSDPDPAVFSTGHLPLADEVERVLSKAFELGRGHRARSRPGWASDAGPSTTSPLAPESAWTGGPGMFPYPNRGPAGPRSPHNLDDAYPATIHGLGVIGDPRCRIHDLGWIRLRGPHPVTRAWLGWATPGRW
jgi:hypothetical protein